MKTLLFTTALALAATVGGCTTPAGKRAKADVKALTAQTAMVAQQNKQLSTGVHRSMTIAERIDYKDRILLGLDDQ